MVVVVVVVNVAWEDICGADGAVPGNGSRKARMNLADGRACVQPPTNPCFSPCWCPCSAGPVLGGPPCSSSQLWALASILSDLNFGAVDTRICKEHHLRSFRGGRDVPGPRSKSSIQDVSGSNNCERRHSNSRIHGTALPIDVTKIRQTGTSVGCRLVDMTPDRQACITAEQAYRKRHPLCGTSVQPLQRPPRPPCHGVSTNTTLDLNRGARYCRSNSRVVVEGDAWTAKAKCTAPPWSKGASGYWKPPRSPYTPRVADLPRVERAIWSVIPSLNATRVALLTSPQATSSISRSLANLSSLFPPKRLLLTCSTIGRRSTRTDPLCLCLICEVYRILLASSFLT